MEINSPPVAPPVFRVSTDAAFHGKKKFWRHLVPAMDRLLGLGALEDLYRRAQKLRLPDSTFCDRLLSELKIQTFGHQSLKASIPESGPVVVVANHPCGGLEGIVLARELSRLRPDTKILVNKFLGRIPELRHHFILTNPLNPGDPENRKSVMSCHRHLKDGGLLLIFPAGKVSYYQKHKQRIADGPWNRLPALLAHKHKASLVPLYVDCQNSKFFHKLGRLSGKIRLFFLPRELAKQEGQTMTLLAGPCLRPADLETFSSPQTILAWVRALTYAQSSSVGATSREPDKIFEALRPPLPQSRILRDLESLPKHQLLHSQSHYSVYYASYQQAPGVLAEISGLREEVFRELDEGSGQPQDTDDFDKSYTHLFAFDHKQNQILGAYRMGQTDLLKSTDNLYLAQMFNFGDSFLNQKQPCLEMGRSFIAKNYQKNRNGLGLLWKGIGAFLKLHPQYSVLYGTVSLSSQFSPLSVALFQALIPFSEGDVTAKNPVQFDLHPEMQDWIAASKVSQKDLPGLIRMVESGEREIPMLYRHYQKLGAKFYGLGLDLNFANTPGLLLSVDLSNTPTNILKRYIGLSYGELKNSSLEVAHNGRST